MYWWSQITGKTLFIAAIPSWLNSSAVPLITNILRWFFFSSVFIFFIFAIWKFSAPYKPLLNPWSACPFEYEQGRGSWSKLQWEHTSVTPATGQIGSTGTHGKVGLMSSSPVVLFSCTHVMVVVVVLVVLGGNLQKSSCKDFSCMFDVNVVVVGQADAGWVHWRHSPQTSQSYGSILGSARSCLWQFVYWGHFIFCFCMQCSLCEKHLVGLGIGNVEMGIMFFCNVVVLLG